MTTIPVPPPQATMASGDQDTRYFSLSADLYPLKDKIAQIVSVVVERADGATPADGDLTILASPPPWISASTMDFSVVGEGYVVNWWQTATVTADTDYLIRVQIETTAGRILDYTCTQTVAINVG